MSAGARPRLSPTARATLALAVALGACGGATRGDAERVCAEGERLRCVGPSGCAGEQTCSFDGAGFGPCRCGPDASEPSDAGVTPAPDAAAGPPSRGELSAPCTTDGDCRPELSCFHEGATDIVGGGPARGYCSLRCTAPEQCEAIETGARCIRVAGDETPAVTTDDFAICMPACPFGSVPDRGSKCAGRYDVGCIEPELGTGLGLCRPMCAHDGDCADSYCNLDTGVCQATPPAGLPIGAECDPNDDACAGRCVTVVDGYSVCTGLCVTGSTSSCGADRTTGARVDAGCFLTVGTPADGDAALCAALCDCDDDCAHPAAACEARDEIGARLGRTGVCVPATEAAGSRPCR